MTSPGPRLESALYGLKVVEFAHVIAGPLAGTLMADLGADVVHVEDPLVGDPHRSAGPKREGKALWWKVTGRNKRCVCIDLRKPEGQILARRLAKWADVVISNFRVSTMDRWGLGWEDLHAENPQLVLLQISGYGASTSKRAAPGFGKVGEAMSGVVELTGFAGESPVHTGFSHGDSVTALMGAYAIQCALYRKAHDGAFDGEYIDLALFESLFRLVEWQIVVYDQLGEVPHRAGNQLAVAPGAVVNTYRSADDVWITVTSATIKSVRSVARLLGEDLSLYETSEQQIVRKKVLDDGLRGWIAERTAVECLKTFEDREIVGSRIYTAQDILEDGIYRERNDIITIEDPDLGPMRMQAVIPSMTNHPGVVWRTGSGLGQDNRLVFEDYLGLSNEELSALKDTGAI